MTALANWEVGGCCYSDGVLLGSRRGTGEGDVIASSQRGVCLRDRQQGRSASKGPTGPAQRAGHAKAVSGRDEARGHSAISALSALSARLHVKVGVADLRTLSYYR